MGCIIVQPLQQRQDKMVQLHQRKQLQVGDQIYTSEQNMHGYETNKFYEKNKKQKRRSKKQFEQLQTKGQTFRELTEKQRQEKSRIRFVINQYDFNPYEMSPVPQSIQSFHKEIELFPKERINKIHLFSQGKEPQNNLPQVSPEKQIKTERLVQMNKGKENCLKFQCICQKCFQNHLSRFLDNTYQKDICLCRGYGVKLERARVSRRCQKCYQQTSTSLQICPRCYGNGFIFC